ARDPHQVSALFNLGVLYMDFLKRPGDAKPLLQRFLDEAPSDHPARGEAERDLKTIGNAAAPAPAAPAPAAAAPAPAPPPGAPPPAAPPGGRK
ncbi:MAG: hypothetical protein JWM74_1948, partial [Myxococcaceae bacterium]|nr:hypothetical protein [Myxococcaceae bacterium]